MVLNVFTKIFDFVMIALIIINLYFRRYKDGKNKRFASILIALIFLIVYVLLITIDYTHLPFWTEYIALTIGIALIAIFHKRTWPFRLHCKKCGKRMSFDAILGRDENVCDDCFYILHPERKAEDEKKKAPPALTEDIIEERCLNAQRVDEIPWDEWEPTERCVLTYVFDGDKVLLILKKTGMGNGYFNAPGGHIELEETMYEAAIRETKEETGLDVENLEERGVLRFQFKSGIRMIGYVFVTSSFSGELINECEETKPFWTKIEDIDYSTMWEDDREWLPLLLDGKKFEGWFIFDDRTMIDKKVEETDEL